MQSNSIAAQKIATVARILTYLGWPFLVLFGAAAAFMSVMVPFALVTKEDDPNKWWAIAVVPVLWIITLLPFLYVKTAKRLRARDPGAGTTAKLLMLLLFIGFPIFTVAAIYSLALLSHYPDYLAEAD